jgi:hypothetical protein
MWCCGAWIALLPFIFDIVMRGISVLFTRATIGFFKGIDCGNNTCLSHL